MRVTRRVERGDWLVDRSSTDARVGGIIGHGFEAYARIFHPVRIEQIDPGRRDEDGFPVTVAEEIWRWSRLAHELGATMHPLVQWPRMTGGRDSFDLGLEWRVAPPTDGRLEPELLAALVGYARLETTTPGDVVAAMWAGWSVPGGGVRYASAGGDSDPTGPDDHPLDDPWAAQRRAVDPTIVEAMRAGPFFSHPQQDSGMEYILMETSLDEVGDPGWVYEAGLGWVEGDDGLLPQFFWPEDRAWVMGTDIDFGFTIVGGSRRLIDAILADGHFEALEVREDDDLTWAGDVINGEGSTRGRS